MELPRWDWLVFVLRFVKGRLFTDTMHAYIAKPHHTQSRLILREQGKVV